MAEDNFRWVAPEPGLAADKFAGWVVAHLADAPRILCHPADLAPLQATILAERVALPRSGVVQRGTVWVGDEGVL